MNPKTDCLILRRKNGTTKILKPGKWFVNRNTPVGEPADFYEVKPYGGKRLIDSREIVAPA